MKAIPARPEETSISSKVGRAIHVSLDGPDYEFQYPSDHCIS